ncbi:MAG: hypothetical protein ACXWG9_06715 [Usitatibacter sp.]
MALLSRLLGAAALGLPAIALAGPADYVYVPSVEYGEREIDFKAGSRRLRDEPVRESAASLGFGYGATQWWFTEAYLKYEKVSGEGAKYDAFEWENKFQLTEPNEYAVDVGFITEIEIPRERRVEGYEFRAGPLFQGDAGPVRWNANLLFERVFRAHSGDPHVTEIGYQLQAKYTFRPELEVGAQAFGEMGQWDHWEPGAAQNHRVGPAVFGKLKLAGRETIRYNAAWLFGASHAAPRNTLRVQAEFEF